MLVAWLKKEKQKVTEIEGKIPSISSLATNSVLTVVENKIPDFSSLVKKTNLDTELIKNSDRVTSNKSRHLKIENKLKKLENLIQAILKVKIILKKMVHKIILFFSQYTYILVRL